MDERTLRIARQHALTSRLLGVDFLPVAGRISVADGGSVAEPPEPSPSVPARARAVEVLVPEGRSVRAPLSPAPLGVESSKAALLAALREKHDRECPHCTHATGHTQTVFSDGDPESPLMFIGEAPGADEDREGIPFVGRSGQLLNQMITAMGLARDGVGQSGVYIANVLKARPPNNDTPTREEAAKCGPYLLEQVRIVAPRAIVTLGNPATHFMLETTQGITSLRGRWQDFRGIPLMPTFHPAYLLRNYTPENRKLVWSDLKAVMTKLAESGLSQS
ncbi:MAG: uracil-DNA glycosylase [Phycisphaerales bacterium]